MGGFNRSFFVCKNNFKKIKNFFKKPQPNSFLTCLIGERSVKRMTIFEAMAALITLMSVVALCCTQKENNENENNEV